jgi:hypothetical protein
MAGTLSLSNLPGFNRTTAFRRRTSRVLPQYMVPEYHPLWPIVSISLFLMGVVLAMYTGLFVAVGGTAALKFVGFPVGIFMVLVIWLLPDVNKPDKPPFYKLLSAYIVLMLWPNYVAVVLPGLPWLTPPRIALAIMLAVMLVHFPQNGDTRRQVLDLLQWDRLSFRMYATYLCIGLLLVPFSRGPTTSLTFLLLQEVLALAPMLLAACVFATRPGMVGRTFNIVTLVGAATMVIAVVENQFQFPPWANYIPSFMRIDPETLEIVLSPQARSTDGRYRIRSIFMVVLYYTQYLNLLLPLFIYAIWRSKGRSAIAAWLLVPLILHTIWFVNARSAFIGLFTSSFGILAMVLARNMFFRKSGDPFKRNLLIVGLMIAFVLLAGALAGSHRLQMYTFGGGQHAASDDSRDLQWSNTWSHLKSNPVGVGPGNSLWYVGVPNFRTDYPVIDSLWINFLVDYGIIGFLAYFGFFVRLGWIGIRTFLNADGEEEEFAGILAISLLNYVLVAYVISQTDSGYIALMFAVGIVTLARQQQARLAGERSLPAPADTPAPATALAVR